MISELIDTLREFNRERDWDQFHCPKNLAMALSVEASEIVEIFQWMTEEESRYPASAKLKVLQDEIGDVVIYLFMLADKLGIDPINAASEKIEKNRLKYPPEKAKGNAKKYKDY